MFWANAERLDVSMDAADLKVFAAVARIGGMNRAANELHTVQSNVTARVRTLEEELGVQLFHRGRKGVTLTAAGKRLLPYAVRVAHLLEEAQKAVKDDGSPRGRLTIGSLETTAALSTFARSRGLLGQVSGCRLGASHRDNLRVDRAGPQLCS